MNGYPLRQMYTSGLTHVWGQCDYNVGGLGILIFCGPDTNFSANHSDFHFTQNLTMICDYKLANLPFRSNTKCVLDNGVALNFAVK